MKRFASIAAAVLALLASANAAPAAAHAPSISLQPMAPAIGVSERSVCDAPARIAGLPYFEFPAIAADEGVTGTAKVRVDLNAAGYLSGSSIYASSGNSWLDEAALRTAHLSRFHPETVGCKTVAGSYLLIVDYTDTDSF